MCRGPLGASLGLCEPGDRLWQLLRIGDLPNASFLLENLGARIWGLKLRNLTLVPSASIHSRQEGGCVWEGWQNRTGDSQGAMRTGDVSLSSPAGSPTRQLNSACHQDMGPGYLSGVYMYFNLKICQPAPLAPVERPPPPPVTAPSLSSNG